MIRVGDPKKDEQILVGKRGEWQGNYVDGVGANV